MRPFWLTYKPTKPVSTPAMSPPDAPPLPVADAETGNGSNSNLDRHVQKLRAQLLDAGDLRIRRLAMPVKGGTCLRVAVVYIDGLSDQDMILQNVVSPILQAQPDAQEAAAVLDYLEERVLTVGSIVPQPVTDQLALHLLASSAVLLIDGQDTALVIASAGTDHRSIGPPRTEPLVRGPQDAFNEVLRINTALLRRRIKDPRLALDPLQIGSMTRTEGMIVYLQGVSNPAIVAEVKRRLTGIQADGLLDSGQLEEYLEDSPYSPFPQISSTERIEKAAAAVLEGKVLVFVDGTPFVLLMPVTFPEFLLSSEDYYYGKFMATTLLRWIRLLAMLMATLLPSVYIALTTFHQEMLPTRLMIAIAASHSGLPFPAFFEALLMEISLELLREASLRLPGGIGQTISVVGALVIGQAAVQANIVGPVLTIIVSFTAIGTFVIPNYNAALSIRLIRFPLMILASLLGIFGMVFGIAVIVIHMVHLRSFGVSYLAPLTPQTLGMVDDSFVFKKPFSSLHHKLSFLGKIKTGAARGGGKRHGRRAH